MNDCGEPRRPIIIIDNVDSPLSLSTESLSPVCMFEYESDRSDVSQASLHPYQSELTLPEHHGSTQSLNRGRSRLTKKLLETLRFPSSQRLHASQNDLQKMSRSSSKSRMKKFFKKLRSRSNSEVNMAKPRSNSVAVDRFLAPPDTDSKHRLSVGDIYIDHNSISNGIPIFRRSFDRLPVPDDGQSNSSASSSPLFRFRRRNRSSSVSSSVNKRKKLKEPRLIAKIRDYQKRARNGSLPDVMDTYGEVSGNENKNKSVSLDNLFAIDFVEDYYSCDEPSSENVNKKSGVAAKDTNKLRLPSLNQFRGKSRSVDHTVYRPFDLVSLRRKIGERTTSEPTRDIPPCSPDPSEIGRENVGQAEKKTTCVISGPSISYSVQPNDTLNSIAARFDTTPSELAKVNRLSTRFLFPGQVLTVPDKGGSKENITTDSTESEIFKDAKVSLSSLSDVSAKGSSYPRTPVNSVDTDRSLDKECLERFLKIHVRHITDGQGVVAGVLLVTPNAVMFDPNVSDPLVIERGSESYGVIAPMDFVVASALYFDIAHMKVKDTELPRPEIPKPEIYLGPSSKQLSCSESQENNDLLKTGNSGEIGSQESPSKDVLELAGSSQENDNDSTCSCGGETRDSSAFPKAFEHELLTPGSTEESPPNDQTHMPVTQQSSSGLGDLTPIQETPRPDEQSPTDEAGSETLELNATPAHLRTSNDKKRTTSVTFSTSSESEMPSVPEDGADVPNQETRKQKVLKRLSYPLSWMDSFAGEKEGATAVSGQQSAPASASVGSAHGHQPSAVPHGDDNKQGMFSNVFSMSNVSNMLTSSPKYLVDISSGLFNRSETSGGCGSLRDIPDLLPQSLPRAQHTSSTPSLFPASFSSSTPSLFPGKKATGEEKSSDAIHLLGRPSLDFVRRPLTQSQVAQSNEDLEENQPAHKRAQFKEGPKFGLKSMVSIDDMPDLFASFDKLIPKPASVCDDPPLYLCLRMGKPIDKPIPKSTPIMTYGKKTMKPEYWFSIPRNRTDDLYNFFQVWAPEIYGEPDAEIILKKGFSLIEEEIQIWPSDKTTEDEFFESATGELKEMTKESWEAASMSEELRRALYSSNSLTSLDLEAFLPEILGTSEMIDDAFRKNMYRKLPARVQGYNWRQIFSTAQHGFSLKSLYRKMADTDSPIILYIQDTSQYKFGAFLSCPLRVSELFYGTGESFMFSCQPEFQIFSWTGENNFFVKGNNESLYIGGGDGNFGIWLDGDLYQGRTQPCKTFGNPVLSSGEDFIVKTIECWSFE